MRPESLKQLVPNAVKDALKQAARPLALDLSARRVAAGGLPVSPRMLAWLRFGWGNDQFTAPLPYLERLASLTPGTTGAILECGSGVSTVLLAAIAREQRRELVSLENDAGWAAHVRQFLRRHGLDAARVLHAPLTDHGAFEWYGVDGADLPPAIGLVACDGPHGIRTRGGRYGMLPVVFARLMPGAQVLLDDAARPAERAVVERWAREFGLTAHVDPEAGRGIAHLTVPLTGSP